MKGDPDKEFLIRQIRFLDRILKGVYSAKKI